MSTDQGSVVTFPHCTFVRFSKLTVCGLEVVSWQTYGVAWVWRWDLRKFTVLNMSWNWLISLPNVPHCKFTDYSLLKTYFVGILVSWTPEKRGRHQHIWKSDVLMVFIFLDQKYNLKWTTPVSVVWFYVKIASGKNCELNFLLPYLKPYLINYICIEKKFWRQILSVL